MEKCAQCNKEFNSQESLEQHKQAVHPKKEKAKNHKKYFIISALIFSVILISATFIIKAKQPGKYDNFAQCLTEKGVIVYGNDFCQYTNKQLNYFGKSAKYLNYIKCFNNKEQCDSKGITITPTWEINGQVYEQVQSFEKLSKLSGCEI